MVDDYRGWRGVGSHHPWTEGTGVEEGNHICSSAVRGVALFAYRSWLCVVGNEICRSGYVLPRLFSCAPARCVGGCGRMRDSGLEEEQGHGEVDWMRIDCSDVWSGLYRSQRRIENLR